MTGKLRSRQTDALRREAVGEVSADDTCTDATDSGRCVSLWPWRHARRGRRRLGLLGSHAVRSTWSLPKVEVTMEMYRGTRTW